MVVHVATDALADPEEMFRKLRREKKNSSDLFVVIYLNGGDETGSQSAKVAQLVDEIQRRMGDGQTGEGVLTIADLRLDRNRHEVQRAGALVHLSPMEFALLEYLMQHRDRVQTEHVLMDAVFGGAPKDGRFNTLWVHMHRLRKKVDREACVRLIHTIRGVGYIIKTPARSQAVPA